MHKFLYHSRVIENERTSSLQEKMNRVGNILHSVVKFVGMLVAALLLNLLLHNIIQHINLLNISALHAFENGVLLIMHESAMSAITYLYEHLWGSMLAIVCIAVGFALCICGDCGDVVYIADDHGSVCGADVLRERPARAVSYRYKVSFLS